MLRFWSQLIPKDYVFLKKVANEGRYKDIRRSVVLNIVIMIVITLVLAMSGLVKTVGVIPWPTRWRGRAAGLE